MDSLNLNTNLFPKNSPYDINKNFTSAYEFDTSYEVQGRILKASQINTNNFVSGTISGTVITGDTVNSGSVVSASILGTILITPNGVTINSGTNSGTVINLLNTGGTSVYQLFLSSNFAHEIINEIDFASNTDNKLLESFGVTAKLADTAGVHAFRIQDNDGAEAYRFASDGSFVQGKAKSFVLKGNIADPGSQGVDTAAIFVQENGGKDQLRVEFNTGASVLIAAEP